MQQQEGPVWRWLAKAKETEVTSGLRNAQGSVLTPAQTMQEVECFWRQHWPSNEGLENKQQALETLHAEAGLADNVCHPAMPPLKAEDLKRTLARQRGKAPGPEGWRPEELWHWPGPALDLLAGFLNAIEEGRNWPRALRQWRQVHLNKPGKSPGVLENLRPISIGAAVYRLWSATRIRQLGPWLRHRLPNQVHGGLPARGVHTALLEPLAELEVAQRAPRGNLKYVGASDLSKAFDALHGALAVPALQRLGVPAPLCRAWQQAWRRQERVLQIAGMCSKEAVTKVECLPQGDPASPAALTAPLVESLRRITKKFSGNRQGRSLHRLFLDDRSWFCEKRKTCLDIGLEWRREVSLWGLGENKSKPDFGVVGTASDRRNMQAELHRREQVGEVKLRPRLLGSRLHTNRAHSKPQHEEQDRLAEAKKLAAWGSHLPCDQARKAYFLKQSAVAKAAAPTYVRLEALRALEGVQSTINRAVRSSGHARGGSLADLFLGHRACLKFRHGHVAAVQVLIQCHLPVLRAAWHQSRSYGPVGLTRRWMQRHGWREAGAFRWTHPATQVTLHSSADHIGRQERGIQLTEQNKDAINHALRDAWRARCWLTWLAQGSNRARPLAALSWPQVRDRFKMAVSILNQLPSELKSHAQAVLVGHFVSPAAFHVMTSPRAEMIPCPFCSSQEVPDFEHMMWSCEHFRETRPLCGAHDPLQRWLAWPSQAKPRRQNLQLILHAAEVRRACYEHATTLTSKDWCQLCGKSAFGANLYRTCNDYYY